MYLTIRQNEKLRNIVMSFEIPYRLYIAHTIVGKYADSNQFANVINNKYTSLTNATQFIKSKLGSMNAKPEKIYSMLSKVTQPYTKQGIEEDVPNISDINALCYIFSELFTDLIIKFADYQVFSNQADKYLYVRNKLNHPGCKTLEEEDMILTLNFISDVCSYISNLETNFFVEKSRNQIIQDINSLQSLSTQIPLKVHNINEMPFPNMHIVCRENEINELKTFIYGISGALRKKSSLCLFGYGGVGKTALVLETIKEIIKDIQDETTINDYKPDFLLFFTAKEEKLDISLTSGDIQRGLVRKSFVSADDLKDKIFKKLGITSFNDYNGKGIIIIDNLESLNDTERNKIKEFVQLMSPNGIQYIVTSRNEENYEERKKIEGFNSDLGKKFISTYVDENDLGLKLDDNDCLKLLELSKGNTLVLVLCLRRLSNKLATIEGLTLDFSKTASISKIDNELKGLPSNGYEIISEFMFKNTFQELESIYCQDAETMYLVLKIFAVNTLKSIDIYTISLLTKMDYVRIEPIISILCRFLIIEREGETYKLNSFAEKYIIQRFLPDSNSYMQLSYDIEKSINSINKELDKFNEDIERYYNLRSIVKDWNIINDGDKIAAAKVYRIYNDVDYECSRGNKFFIQSSLRETLIEMETIERTTMHPYIKYQRARIYQKIDKCGVLGNKHNKEIADAYRDTIWLIKTNSLYMGIKSTKSYASVLWLFGAHLHNNNSPEESIRYLEDAYNTFIQLNIKDKDFFQCYTLLGYAYLAFYEIDINKNKAYLEKSRDISRRLYEQRYKYNYLKKVKSFVTSLHLKLMKYGKY